MIAQDTFLRRLCWVTVGLVAAGCSLLPSVPEPPAVAEGPDPSAERLEALDTETFLISDEVSLVGGPQVVFSRYEDTLSDIAREYNLGYEELRAANPDVDPWLPGEGTPVFLPTHFIVPDVPREGVVLNLPSMRLFYFSAEDEGQHLVTHPIGIGRSGWETPTGSTNVVAKARDPVWYVPASIRAEHAEMGDPLPPVVEPGPDNPLGRFALQLGMPGYLIHGTNQPYGVGMRVSHGCVRLYPENIEELFDEIAVGTAVKIVNQPVLAAWSDDRLFLEVHPLLEEDERDLLEQVWAEIERVMASAGQPVATIDEQLVAKVVEQRRGLPFPVSRFSPIPEGYMANARIVVNTAPIITADTELPTESR